MKISIPKGKPPRKDYGLRIFEVTRTLVDEDGKPIPNTSTVRWEVRNVGGDLLADCDSWEEAVEYVQNYGQRLGLD